MAEKLRRDIERIVQLTDDEFEEVLSFFTIKDFKKHQFIFEKGEKVVSLRQSHIAEKVIFIWGGIWASWMAGVGRGFCG